MFKNQMQSIFQRDMKYFQFFGRKIQKKKKKLKKWIKKMNGNLSNKKS